MLVENLLKNVEIISQKGVNTQDILSISFDCRDECDMFLSLKLDKDECEKDIKLALQNGAKVVVSQIQCDCECPHIVVENIRSAMSLIACNFYGNPSKNMKIIGVTGTNGKTTSTYIMKSILENSGYKVGLIGTNCNIIDNTYYKSHLTTPDPLELQHLFSQMNARGCDYVVMEVSAHSLYFDKIDGVYFESAIFTNLTQDHLDFFKNMQAYGEAKSKLFNKKFCKNAIFNVDDDFGHMLAKKCDCNRVLSYGIDNPSDIFAVNLDIKLDKSNFFVNAKDDICQMSFHIGGKYNVYNVLGCIACAHSLGIDLETIKIGVENLNSVDGRYNTYKSSNGYSVVIDYAHTPDGLENLLNSIKPNVEKRLITVFGCGGNRDKTKRAIMGKVAGEKSNFTILTSDNPRYENPNSIISDIEKGLETITNNYIKIENRLNAIDYAMQIAKEGDVVVIAGKGQEDYQEIKGKRHHFSDKEVVQKFLQEEKVRKEFQLQN